MNKTVIIQDTFHYTASTHRVEGIHYLGPLMLGFNTEQERDDARLILKSKGPIELVQLNYSTEAIEDDYLLRLEVINKRYIDLVRSAACDDDIVLAGNSYAESIHALNDWKHDRLAEIETQTDG
jgi:hypothetical protein